MENQTFTCPKCNGNMIKGFIADRSDIHFFPMQWIEGEPENATLFGLKGDNLQIHDKKRFVLRSLRCEQCGFAEIYAV
jgi:predicted nucleic-acid-binding Zn-ribbon protein